MHELALVEAALDHALAVARRAGALRIEQLTFRVAADSHITRDTLQTLVDALARGTPTEGAVVQLEVELRGGPELALVSVDVEVGPACAV